MGIHDLLALGERIDAEMLRNPKLGRIEVSGPGFDGVHWVKAENCVERVQDMLARGCEVRFQCADPDVARSVNALLDR